MSVRIWKATNLTLFTAVLLGPKELLKCTDRGAFRLEEQSFLLELASCLAREPKCFRTEEEVNSF